MQRITQRDLVLLRGLDRSSQKVRTHLRRLLKAGARVEPGELTIDENVALGPPCRPLIVRSMVPEVFEIR